MSPSPSRVSPWRVAGWIALAAALLALIAVAAGVVRDASPTRWFGEPAPPTVTHAVVVERLRDVSKLVSTEMTLRDVVQYRQSRFGSVKQTLLVVTGRVMAGIDLERGADVRIDHEQRHITVVLPPAEILALDVVNVQTYDERAGLLNPFRPEDRDAIQRQIRAQLLTTARQSGVLARADESANRLVQALLTRDGYTVEISRPPVVRTR
ncbi:MAG TPA: DUF4230 domain-containing protein [Gemmatimonadaceae bacterium]|nr:DUF4230 domain-containing protein [Gemmatimonadaceae bacterium]